jgi:hypothetical protein
LTAGLNANGTTNYQLGGLTLAQLNALFPIASATNLNLYYPNVTGLAGYTNTSNSVTYIFTGITQSGTNSSDAAWFNIDTNFNYTGTGTVPASGTSVYVTSNPLTNQFSGSNILGVVPITSMPAGVATNNGDNKFSGSQTVSSNLIAGNALIATNGIFLPTNTFVPTASASGGWLWNSNQSLYWVTKTHTNLLSNP